MCGKESAEEELEQGFNLIGCISKKKAIQISKEKAKFQSLKKKRKHDFKCSSQDALHTATCNKKMIFHFPILLRRHHMVSFGLLNHEIQIVIVVAFVCFIVTA